jgi:hypothetical protein
MRLMDSLHFTSAACMSCGRRIDHPRVALSNWQWRVRDLSRIRSILGQQWRRSEGFGAQRRRHHPTTGRGHRGRTAGSAHAAMRIIGNAGQCRLSPRPVSFSAKVRAFKDFVAAQARTKRHNTRSTAQGMWPIRNTLPPNRGSWHRDSTQMLSHRVKSPAN